MNDEQIDAALLEALMQDGRISGSELTRRIAAPPTRVRARLLALLDREHMRVTAFVDPAIEEVAWCAHCRSGRVYAQVSVGSAPDLLAVLQHIRGLPGVSRVGTNLIVRGLSRPVGHASDARPFAFVGAATVPHDDTDLIIIRALQLDGRTPFRHLADLTALSIPAVRQRYRRLVSSGALSVVARPLPALLGRDTCAHLVATVDGPTTGLAELLAEIPDVTFVAETAGDADIMLEIAAVDESSLQHRVARVRALMPGSTLRVDQHVEVRATRANF
jgi:DNA-binding Lrp family transcriptional regulator